MARMEEDLGTTLDWVAVDHHDTGHSRVHVVVRGVAEDRKTLNIAGGEAAATELAIGARSAVIARAYGAPSLFLGLASHDISAMRELLGRPERVLCATQRLSGRVITGVFDFGRYVCQFEAAVDQIPRFDAHIEVLTDAQVFRLDYDTPYVRHQPARLSVTERHGAAGLSHASAFPSRYDSFAIEWREFRRNIVEGRRPKTSIADAREDLEIFRDMVALME